MSPTSILAAKSEVYALIRKLGSRRASVRDEAEQALKHLTEDQVVALIQISRSEIKKSRLRLVVGLAAYLCVSYLVSYTWASLTTVVHVLFLLSLPLDYIMLLRLISNPRLQNNIMRAITLPQDPRLLGPLIAKSARVSNESNKLRIALARLMGLDPNLHADVISAIRAIVSNIKPGDEISLDATEYVMFEGVLRSPDVSTVLRVLRVVEIIGDSRFRVILLALEAGSYSGAENAEVREAAARCWATIASRLADQKQIGTLLRSSQSDAVSTELVLPVKDSQTDARAVLLRALPEEDLR